MCSVLSTMRSAVAIVPLYSRTLIMPMPLFYSSFCSTLFSAHLKKNIRIRPFHLSRRTMHSSAAARHSANSRRHKDIEVEAVAMAEEEQRARAETGDTDSDTDVPDVGW
ncbi:uncharacterized protein LOC131039559 isoform X2 [Cryptomeria japonica]|uniref:uncharacterized protein LOC131039559 isoform X2 n=1 Tax=Cryptomeria japonica TaxID=3369 RepID=UPI0027DA041F|nr:uncharacterized protein LOC131039559 isoform X2 [Cryptomeria japonica]